jgi:DNA-directed RNA polymerase
MWQMFGIVRQAFIWVHSKDVLEDFRNQCVKMYRDHLLATRTGLDWYKAAEMAEDTVPRVPHRGELDIRQVADSDYFFA